MTETKYMEKSTRPYQLGKAAYHSDNDKVKKEGRRTWLKYADLGAETATGGQLLAHTMAFKAEQPRIDTTTGWHYHTCEHQFVYVTKGWLDLELEDGNTVRVHARDSIYIPGGYKHNEIGVADDYECLEVVVPGQIGTVACDAPEGWVAKHGKA